MKNKNTLARLVGLHHPAVAVRFANGCVEHFVSLTRSRPGARTLNVLRANGSQGVYEAGCVVEVLPTP